MTDLPDRLSDAGATTSPAAATQPNRRGMSRCRAQTCPGRHRGAAALGVTLLLLLVMALGGAWVQRGLVVEQRASAHQAAAVQAFEAAEAGLQWAEAQLNAGGRIGADCLPSTAPTAATFRDRMLQQVPATDLLRPRHAAGTASAACVKTATGFGCDCPNGGAPSTLARPAGDGPFPAFRLSFAQSGLPGRLRVVATGCSTALPPCIGSGGTRADASARIEVTLGLLGALRLPPTAALTAGGSVEAPAATFLGGTVAVRAGGAVVVGSASGTGAGGPTSGSGPLSTGAPVLRTEPALAALGADRFFAASFGLDKQRWRDQAAVTRVVCSSDCAAALVAATGDAGSGAIVRVDGDLTLAGPVVIGAPGRPVLIVVDGAATLRGGVEIHGAVYAASLRWDDAAPGAGAAVHGAVLVERDVRGDATVAFVDDPAALSTLTRFSGSFARIAGSWRDF